MSLINKMLQDLDKRHAADGAGKPLTQQLRPVQERKDWKRIVWEVGAGLAIGAGWSAWVLYQISPRPIVTELVYQLQAKRPPGLRSPAGPQPAPGPAAPAPPAPAQALPAQAPPAVAMTAPAPAALGTQAPGVDTLKLARDRDAVQRKKSRRQARNGTCRRRARGAAEDCA